MHTLSLKTAIIAITAQQGKFLNLLFVLLSFDEDIDMKWL